jgi:DNA-binding NtrC family response regulator
MPLRILVVDDDEPVARALCRDLEATIQGAVVDAVYDGASAVALLKQREHDACIIDWMMSPVPGAAVVQAARDCSCPCVVLSGYMDVRTTVEAMKSGAETVLEKPVHLASLLEALPQPRGSRSDGSGQSAARSAERDARVRGDSDELESLPLRELERRRILRTFRESGENVSMTARQLGLPRSTLRDKLRRYGVT